jgi:hypothetical protein
VFYTAEPSERASENESFSAFVQHVMLVYMTSRAALSLCSSGDAARRHPTCAILTLKCAHEPLRVRPVRRLKERKIRAEQLRSRELPFAAPCFAFICSSGNNSTDMNFAKMCSFYSSLTNAEIASTAHSGRIRNCDRPMHRQPRFSFI